MITHVPSFIYVFSADNKPFLYGIYNIDPFTFTNTNTTPIKLVEKFMCVWFNTSSANTSNGKYRSIKILSFFSHVS